MCFPYVKPLPVGKSARLPQAPVGADLGDGDAVQRSAELPIADVVVPVRHQGHDDGAETARGAATAPRRRRNQRRRNRSLPTGRFDDFDAQQFVAHPEAMSMLIFLNGPPAAGKSTLARMYCADHPLALALDIDGVRHLLGRWQKQPHEAGLAARAIAVAAAHVHLAAGYDVVVPQLAAHSALLSEMATAATAAGAHYLEFVVGVSRNQSMQRYTQRWLAGQDAVHGSAGPPDLGDVGRTYDRLIAFAASRHAAVSLSADSLSEMYQALLSAIRNSA